MWTDIGRGFLAQTYVDAMYDMLTAYDFLIEDVFPNTFWM